MTRIISYTVVMAEDVVKLQEEVATLIMGGWQPIGGVAVGHDAWVYQAIVMYSSYTIPAYVPSSPYAPLPPSTPYVPNGPHVPPTIAPYVPPNTTERPYVTCGDSGVMGVTGVENATSDTLVSNVTVDAKDVAERYELK